MEDIIALILVVGIFALFAWGVTTLIKRVKREKEREAERKVAADKYWKEQREKVYIPSQWAPATPFKPATKTKKKETVGQTYANMNTQTAQTASSDDGFLTGMLTGMVIDSLTHSHKSEPSVGVSSTTKDDTFSWGLDDSDSRKSISDTMDTSSSWFSNSSDSSSSDSGPSSDW